MDTLTHAELASCLQYDQSTGVFTWTARKFVPRGKQAGQTKDRGYVHLRINGHTYRAHRLAWFYVTGAWPVGPIDHKNGNPSDNRFENLRVVTTAENQQNQRRPHRRNKVGLLGVSAAKERFEARIQVGHVTVRLGRFDTPEEASQAYLKQKARLHPAFIPDAGLC